ncbi:MAG: hypothetical protein DMG14_30565 [Acidobacteria bacterium]|nr:MAG: hypothetical protein DMG14_30565 [Acidobacteriota bacterium]
MRRRTVATDQRRPADTSGGEALWQRKQVVDRANAVQRQIKIIWCKTARRDMAAFIDEEETLAGSTIGHRNRDVAGGRIYPFKITLVCA